MPKKTKATARKQGVFIGSYLEPDLHRALKSAAKVNDRSLVREIGHRLKLSIKAEQQERALQAVE